VLSVTLGRELHLLVNVKPVFLRAKTGDFGSHTEHNYPLNPSKTHFLRFSAGLEPILTSDGSQWLKRLECAAVRSVMPKSLSRHFYF